MIHRNENGTISYGRFDYAIQILIILSLVSFAVETLPGLSPSSIWFLDMFETVSVVFFTIECLARVLLAGPRVSPRVRHPPLRTRGKAGPSAAVSRLLRSCAVVT